MNFKQDSGFVDAVTKCSDNIARFVNGLNLGYDPLGEVKKFPVDWGLLASLGCMQLDGEGQYFRVLDFYNEKIKAVQHGSWRSYDEQEKLFAIGRQIGYKKVYGSGYVSDTNVPTCLRSEWTYEKDIKKIGDVVTNTRGGRSFHNYGLAVDIVLRHFGESIPKSKAVKVNGKLYDTLCKIYEDSGIIAWAKHCKLEWGGYWTDFPDPAHWQDTAYDIIPYKLYGQYNLQNEKNCSFKAVKEFSKGLWDGYLKKYQEVLDIAKDTLENGTPLNRGAYEKGKEEREKFEEDVKETVRNNWFLILGVLAGGLAFLHVFFGKDGWRR